MASKSTQQPYFAGTAFTLIIIAAVVFISWRYLTPLAWAGLITIASWPAYQRLLKAFGRRDKLTALTMTLILSLIILLPLSWLIITLTKELISATTYLTGFNQTGITMPTWLAGLPLIGHKLSHFWLTYLAKPKFVEVFLQYANAHYPTVASYAQAVGVKTLYHSISMLFCLITIFFLYLNGEYIGARLNHTGLSILPGRWQRYYNHLPSAIRSVVNGSILVGLGVGILMGISYALAGLPLPVLFGFLTAILAMIPFGMILTLLVVTLILLVQSSFIAAIVVLIWGTLVSLISDNVVKPALISGSTKLPFLMILIGILGGVENLGLIGLFAGPIIMVMFYTLFDELSS